MTGVHRIVEAHAAGRGSEAALVCPDATLTFRDLNRRANSLSRYLIGRGLRRSSRAVVKMKRCPDLAIALLAVLKAGAAYTWRDLRDDDIWPEGISLVRDGHHFCELQVVIPPCDVNEASSGAAPNLPILTRGHDIACVLPQHDSLPGLLVPHSTIVALRAHPVPTPAAWSSDLSALDLWVPLMAGAPVTLRPVTDAAAA